MIESWKLIITPSSVTPDKEIGNGRLAAGIVAIEGWTITA